jgi:hypothetical protein
MLSAAGPAGSSVESGVLQAASVRTDASVMAARANLAGGAGVAPGTRELDRVE